MKARLTVELELDDDASLYRVEDAAAAIEIELTRRQEVVSAYVRRMRIERPRKGGER